MKQKESRVSSKARFTVGDIVIHRITGQKMTIKRLGKEVATCIKDIPEPWYFYGIEHPGDTAVCLLDNLQHEKDPPTAASVICCKQT